MTDTATSQSDSFNYHYNSNFWPTLSRNDLWGPKIAKSCTILRDDYTKSYIQKRPLALVLGS